MKPASAKAKARRLQNTVVEMIRNATGLTEADVRPAIMGERGADVKLSVAGREAFPYAIEAKNTERLNIWAAIRQAERNADGLTPLVVIKRNRSKIWAVIEFERLLELMDRSGGLREG